MTVETESKSDRRPWIDQIQSFDGLVREEESKVEVSQGIKLGWVKGVLIPCLLSIWGVMLFLKMPWILAQAGIFESVVIILISLVIILITTFSLSAVSTNGKVKGGGLYFIISRSIGPEFGASMGIVLAFANTISAAMNTIGFCKSLRSLLNSNHIHVIDNNIVFRALGVVCIIIQSVLCCIGMDREAEVQNALLVAIIVGIFNVVIGSYLGPTNKAWPNEAKASGFTGFSMETFKSNWYPKYTVDSDNKKQSFITIFAFFFPSVTGIQAGANISGDLKDPSASIPKGTLWSILITITSYIVLIVVPGAVQLREASGDVGEYNRSDNSYILNCSTRNCTKGLYNDPDLMQSISLWPITIYFGCWGATISTSLIALLSVPKLLQRMGQDDVYPLLKYLAKSYGKNGEPYRAHVFAMFVSSMLLIFSELDNMATLISTIYLSAYALLNFCTFHVAYFKPLGWRPSFKFYNKWLSLAGAVICTSIMIFISWETSALVACAIFVLYNIAARKHYVLNWGSSKQTELLKTVVKNTYRSNTIQYHVKNFLPNVIVLSGRPESRKKLVSLGNLITKNNGLQTCVNVEKRLLAIDEKKSVLDEGFRWLEHAKVKSLYVVIDDAELDTAARVVYNCGHGQLRPNIVLIGYKSDWLNCPNEERQTFFNVFNVANANGITTIMVRVSSTEGVLKNRNVSVQDVDCVKKQENIPNKRETSSKKHRKQHKICDFSVNVIDEQYSFTKKHNRPRGTVDVWWIYNDGGLSLLLACVLRSSSTWKNCKFRIFGVTDKFENLAVEKNKLKQLLSMYRVRFDYLDIILANATDPTTMTYFTSLLKIAFPEENDYEGFEFRRNKVAETLFLRDLIELHSYDSDLIVLSTPMFERDLNALFMCWIETITRGLPPCIIINGDAGPVLTANA